MGLKFFRKKTEDPEILRNLPPTEIPQSNFLLFNGIYFFLSSNFFEKYQNDSGQLAIRTMGVIMFARNFRCLYLQMACGELAWLL